MPNLDDLAAKVAELERQVARFGAADQLTSSTVGDDDVDVAEAAASGADAASAIPQLQDDLDEHGEAVSDLANVIASSMGELDARLELAGTDLEVAREAIEEAQQQISDAFGLELDGLSDRVDTVVVSAGDAGESAEYARALAQQAKDDAAAANSLASTAKSAADTANSAALSASGLAASKGEVIVQVSAPTGTRANPANLWIDITTDASGKPRNTPNRYNATTSKWEPITDQKVIDAAAVAAAAQSAAATAQAAANTADGKAVAAQTSANNAQTTANNAGQAASAAQTTADQAKTNAANAQTAADAAKAQALTAAGIANGKGTVYAQTNAPTVVDPFGLWVDTDDGNKPYIGANYGVGPLTNRVLNPGFHAGVAQWSSGASWDSTRKRLVGTLSAAIGEGGGAMQTTVAATAGERRRFGAWFYNTSSKAITVSLQVIPRNGSTTLTYFEGAQYTVQPGDSAWITNTPVAYPTNTTAALVTIRVGPGGWAAGTTFALDQVIDTEAGAAALTPADYFDGSLPGVTWSGTANASVSTYAGPAWIPSQDQAIVAAATAAGQAQTAADTAKTNAATAQQTADQAKAAASNAQGAADAAQATANTAKTNAATAQSAADAANTQALAAAGIANGKGKVIVQVSAPTGANATAENLWIDVTANASGVPRNTPNRYGPLTVPDPNVVARILAAAAAQTETEVMRASVAPNAQTPVSLTLSASMALNGVAKSGIARLRDGVAGPVLASYVFSDKGDSTGGNAETWTLPAGFTATPSSGVLVVTIQSNNTASPDIYSLHRTITASNWQAVTDQKAIDAAAAASAAQSTADTAKTNAATAQTAADAAKSAAATAQTTADQAKSAAATAQTAADNANTQALSAAGIANGKGRVIYQATAPTGTNANAQNLWIRTTDNTPWTYNGSTWVQVTDKTATDAAAAAAAANTAAGNAKAAADAAQATANGRPLILFSTSGPSGNAPTGSTWFQVNSADSVVGQWQQTGSPTSPVWTPRPITSDVIANLDVGKLTAGTAAIATLVAQKIAASTATFQTVNVANLFVTSGATMQQAVIDYLFANVVQAKKITADMIDVNSLSGVTLTGTILQTASSGKRVVIGGTLLRFYDENDQQSGQIEGQANGAGGGVLRVSPDGGASAASYFGTYPMPIGGSATFRSPVMYSDRYARSDDTDWINATLKNGYTNRSGNPAQYKRVNGVVYLRGQLYNANPGTAAFTLPVGFRPDTRDITMHGGVTPWQHYTQVATSGDVNITSGSVRQSSTGYILDGIQFVV